MLYFEMGVPRPPAEITQTTYSRDGAVLFHSKPILTAEQHRACKPKRLVWVEPIAARVQGNDFTHVNAAVLPTGYSFTATVDLANLTLMLQELPKR